jgi:hypothetical protein
MRTSWYRWRSRKYTTSKSTARKCMEDGAKLGEVAFKLESWVEEEVEQELQEQMVLLGHQEMLQEEEQDLQIHFNSSPVFYAGGGGGGGAGGPSGTGTQEEQEVEVEQVNRCSRWNWNIRNS